MSIPEDFISREINRAISEAERPSGMSTHDGKARVDAAILRRLLAERAALLADAERWRYVRRNPWRAIDILRGKFSTRTMLWHTEVDDAFDDALKESGK